MLLGYQEWCYDHCCGGLVPGVQDMVDNGGELIHLGGCHPATLHKITPYDAGQIRESLEKLQGFQVQGSG